MYVLRKRKYTKTVVLVLLLIFVSKLGADESLQVSDDAAGQGSDNTPVTAKVQEVKSDESEHQPSNVDEKNENSKLEKSEQSPSSIPDDKIQNTKTEESDNQQIVDSKHQNEKVEGSDQPPGAHDEKNEETKLEDTDHPSVVVEAKKQNSKEEESNHKTNLNDVNSYTAEEGHVKAMKRETRYTEFLGLPRDSSYFFDDLEPFINNNSDNRVGRAAPSRENKGQKSKLSGKGKEVIEDDADDDEEEGNDEEEEKVNEDDYDDDEDMDSDCQPTPACTSSTACPTTPPPCTTSPKCTTIPKCTTEFQCPTTCRTTPEKTKCPRICVKASRRIVNNSEKGPDSLSDSDKKKPKNNKRRLHSKVH